MREHLLRAHLHHHHDGALDPHVVSCGASVPRCKALNLSSECQPWCQLPTNTCWRATPRWVAAPIGKGRTKQDARRKRDTGTARPHELGLRRCLDPHARGWAVQLGTGANGSSTGRLILRRPRAACWVACTERHGRGRHEEAVGRVATTTRGYLQPWATNWADWAPRWGSLQVPQRYVGANQS